MRNYLLPTTNDLDDVKLDETVELYSHTFIHFTGYPHETQDNFFPTFMLFLEQGNPKSSGEKISNECHSAFNGMRNRVLPIGRNRIDSNVH